MHFPIQGLSQTQKKFLPQGNGCTGALSGRSPGSLCQSQYEPKLSKLPFSPSPNPIPPFSLLTSLMLSFFEKLPLLCWSLSISKFFSPQCSWYVSFFFGCTNGVWKFLGQGSNLCHSSDNSGCLTHCATREVLDVSISFLIYRFSEALSFLLLILFFLDFTFEELDSLIRQAYLCKILQVIVSQSSEHVPLVVPIYKQCGIWNLEPYM